MSKVRELKGELQALCLAYIENRRAEGGEGAENAAMESIMATVAVAIESLAMAGYTRENLEFFWDKVTEAPGFIELQKRVMAEAKNRNMN